MAFKFDYKKSTLSERLKHLIFGAPEAVKEYAETMATIIEADAKANRPWTDQTGAAKARLTASVSFPRLQANKVRIDVVHGVYYGVYLELANEKKYAIVEPTIKKWQAEVVEGLQGIMEKM